MPATVKPPIWFWTIAVLLALWGLTGVGACIQQLRLGAEAMGQATDYDRALWGSLPGWYKLVYAVAVGAGFLGSLALILRRRIAWRLYLVSLVAVIVQFGWVFLATDLIAAKGAGATAPFPVFIVAVAGFQLWLARHAKARGWIA